MKKIVFVLCMLFGFSVNAQGYDFQQLCLDCAEVNGFYCGDDESNWTQYAPLGCVVNNWLNDGWEDCVDASDEGGAVPTTPLDCVPEEVPCDTIYVDVPVIEYIYITDTIVEIEYIDVYITEYIDCETNMPCNNSSIQETLNKSIETGLMYNLLGQVIRKPESIYIQNGKIKYIMN